MDPSLERIRKLGLEELAQKPIARPWWKDALLLCGINAFVAAACTLALGREGLVLNEAAPLVLVAVASPVVLTLFMGALTAVMPSRAGRVLGLLGLAGLAAVAVIVGGSGATDGRSFLAQGIPCMSVELVAAAVPTIVAVLVLSHFAYDPLRMFVGGLAAGAAGLFALHLHCPIGTVTHLALFHVAPWIGAATLAVLCRSRMRSRSFAP